MEGEGSPLVLLAGGRWDMKSFSAPAAAFSSDHKVIRMEHFNVQYADEGRALPSGYSLKLESEAIGKTLDSLAIVQPVILVGWSFGALLALDFALNHPDRIEKLVLYEPPAFWVAKARKESPEGMKEMINLSKKFKPQSAISSEQLARFRAILDNSDPATIQKLPNWPQALKNKDRLRGLSVVAKHKDKLKRLRTFTKPVLILTGRGTVAFHKRINELLAEEFPKATSVEIAGGHSAPDVAVKEFIEAIRRFIRK